MIFSIVLGKFTRMKGIKYPKFILLIISLIVAYAFFHDRDYTPLHNFLSSLGYFSFFLSGIFYAYGFTAAPATAILLSIAKGSDLVIASLIGGLGAAFGSSIIFLFIRNAFNDEIKKLSKEKAVKFIEKEERFLFGNYDKYATAAFVGFLIASPLPNELAMGLMATFKHMSMKKFMVISYLLNTLGIFVILLIGSSI